MLLALFVGDDAHIVPHQGRCWFCGANHDPRSCDKAVRLNYRERWLRTRIRGNETRQNICYQCLSTDHPHDQCDQPLCSNRVPKGDGTTMPCLKRHYSKILCFHADKQSPSVKDPKSALKPSSASSPRPGSQTASNNPKSTAKSGPKPKGKGQPRKAVKWADKKKAQPGN